MRIGCNILSLHFLLGMMRLGAEISSVYRPCTSSLTPKPTDTVFFAPRLLATVEGEPQNADAFKTRECEQDETRRPKPKTAIIEAGMHPHPGPKAATAAEAMKKAAKQRGIATRMMRKTRPEKELAPPTTPAAKKAHTEQLSSDDSPLGLPPEHNQKDNEKEIEKKKVFQENEMLEQLGKQIKNKTKVFHKETETHIRRTLKNKRKGENKGGKKKETTRNKTPR